MPRKKIGAEVLAGSSRGELAAQLAAELKSAREYGQPLVYEQEFRTGKVRVTVIWDAWDRLPLEERTSLILRAYEMAEGPDFRSRIALASGLTVPEAHAAGMLPYQILPALRLGDPVTPEQAREALLAEGASALVGPQMPQLRFTTQEEAEAALQRLSRRLPGSAPIWVINREITAQDFAAARDGALLDAE
jgi:hypothetical protein